jgi:site-specific recombinase XerD
MKRFIELANDFLIYDEKENTYSERTKEKKHYQFDHLCYFLYSQGLQDLRPDEIKIRHMMLYKEWLRDNTTAKTHEHISRHIRMCSNVIDYGVAMDYAEHNCLLSMKLKKDPVKEIISLDGHEIELYENYKAIRPLWQIAIDLYLFMVYTGISYMDLWLFRITKEKIFYNGRIVNLTLITSFSGRGKNGRLYWAEFIPRAQGIWEKYNRLFPQIHVQTFNHIIKAVAKELEISKKLSTHTGRKTFANIKDDEGYSPAYITKMMGNNEQTLLKHYLKKNKKSLLLEIVKKKCA